MTNGEKYVTAHERAEAFRKYCEKTHDIAGGPCVTQERCSICSLKWLDLECEEEKPLPCPFCASGETKVVGINHAKKVLCECCKAEGSEKDSTEQAVEAWNTVVKFFMKGKR